MFRARQTLVPTMLVSAVVLGGWWSTSWANNGDDETGERAVLVREVIDGDTIVVRVGGVDRRIALLGTRLTPEGVADAECFLRHLLTGEKVTLQWHDRAAGADALGRLRALVRREPDGLFVNLEMARQGYADVDDSVAFPELSDIKRQAAAAKSDGRGIWGAPCRGAPSAAASDAELASDTTPIGIGNVGGAQKPPPIATENGMVCVTKSGKKYHRPDCASVRNSATKRALTLEEARKRYSPCSRCNPPQ